MTPVWDRVRNRTGDLWISGRVLYNWANSPPIAWRGRLTVHRSDMYSSISNENTYQLCWGGGFSGLLPQKGINNNYVSSHEPCIYLKQLSIYSMPGHIKSTSCLSCTALLAVNTFIRPMLRRAFSGLLPQWAINNMTVHINLALHVLSQSLPTNCLICLCIVGLYTFTVWTALTG